MAIYRLRYKCGKTAVSHLEYIAREGRYKNKDDFVIKKEFNVPKDFKNINDFWKNAEVYERKNANIYREFEIALAKEFSNKYNQEILEKFLEKTFKNDYVYNYAIHNPKEEQPHAHIMFCDRKLDGIKRNSENFFKRYNNINPELGGAKKDEELKKKKWVFKIRKDWEEHFNKYLSANGIENISSETLKKQREKAIKKGDILKAEILNREAIHVNKNIKYSKDKKDLKSIDNDIKIKNQEKEKQLNKEIENAYFQLKLREEYEKKAKELKNKSFEEVLKIKEQIESNIFNITKKLDDKKLESRAEDELSGGKINKLKNEKRMLFKKTKNDKENKKKYKSRIDEINKFIEDFQKNNKNKIYEKKLEIKSKLTKALKFKIREKTIIDQIFKKYLIDNSRLTLDQKNLYKAYIERKDLREEINKKKEIFYKNKENIKKNIGINNKKVQYYKSANNKIYLDIKSSEKAQRAYSRSLNVVSSINSQGEFLLNEYRHINWDEEYEINQFER